eukprot:CAMPEP_0176386266 /NCGR_PEP_ID=MMETSP0126-20121128/35819_1 /TAXON_ID=141414 ORGANISM="Strombidinopsis acuminatum, Strain SPMC142" /NCGR_SAMPLE_ID=MMETSP0126 /ASSEMBLY_ACC=CAM_ASM_000229 /LENGTH=37 /DNA_ID= /DNA_START= /DNA_END= /DNA_ORIENTATION=
MNAGKKERKFSNDEYELKNKSKDGRKSFTGSTGFTID